MYILNNGKLTRNKNIISIEDRGYLLGDAVFETILYKDKDLILFNLHLDRLISSLKLKNGCIPNPKGMMFFELFRSFSSILHENAVK